MTKLLKLTGYIVSEYMIIRNHERANVYESHDMS